MSNLPRKGLFRVLGLLLALPKTKPQQTTRTPLLMPESWCCKQVNCRSQPASLTASTTMPDADFWCTFRRYPRPCLVVTNQFAKAAKATC
ncbi:uncharacterized protein B0I36DRAFT_4069 [Microdochium trichocladiopsis]|uniref:Secreted protein n=1 Tax=Microdochium trichocladiopsis TaxID=1682393 RepID=A0A9P9BV52_9PEZI|nr:uncharacterized protein B0I36DRAFT_4069 [Microdochium trichocladiopsis]KAH7039973.1 hypothetical protein B0I36DRAFT_4069 [Microdochium trichocladiopsis]